MTIDLRRVDFLDCLGLALLLEQHDRSARRGLRVDFVQGPPAVRRMFELTGTLEPPELRRALRATPRLDRLSGGSQPVGRGRETAPRGRLPALCHVRHVGRKLRTMNPSLMQHATSAAVHTDRLRRARKGRRS